MLENTYFEYCIDPTADEPIMLILKQIGNTYDEWGNITEWGVQGADFCKELLLLDSVGKSRIQIWINSIGGSVIDGYSILGAMLKTKAKVDTYNIGVAASTAGWLFQAGRTRDMSDYATWMGHNPHSSDGEDSEILQKFRDSIIKIISERTGTGLDETGKMLDKETYKTASECLRDGFCDTITATSRQNVKKMSGAKSIQDKYKLALEISNIALPTKKINNMEKFPVIINKLNTFRKPEDALHEASSETMIVEAIDGLYNRAAIAESGLTSTKDALRIANKAKDDLQTQYDDLKKKMDKIKADMEEAEEADNLKKAKDMVNGFAQMGKIVNTPEEINNWVTDAAASKEAFEKVKNRLTNLPVNKEAKKLVITGAVPGTGTGGPKNAAQRMHEIAQRVGQK